MGKKVVEAEKNPEERLKIKEIKKLKNKNKILSILKEFGIGVCVDIYCVGFLSIFGEGLGIGTIYPKFWIILMMFITSLGRRKFSHGIPKILQENNELILKIQNEIDNKEELERVK